MLCLYCPRMGLRLAVCISFLSVISWLSPADTLFAADLDIEFELVARSGETPIPGGVGVFTGFGGNPAVDASGNVLFTGTGNAANGKSFQSGVYTFINNTHQKVADRNTLVPGGNGETFDVFRGADQNDIDGGRVAFVADVSASSTVLGVYSNVGQASAETLTEVALADGSEWSVVSDPWVDGNVVAVRGQRLVPDKHNTILVWDGSATYVNPGSGYIVSPGTVASISEGVSVFRRYQTGSSQLGVYENGVYDALVTLGETPMPGQDGLLFTNVNNYPVTDNAGQDVALRGNGAGGVLGLYKRTNGGALTQVADNATVVPGSVPIPGWGEQLFSMFIEDGTALAGGHVAFWAEGLNSLEGLYTDIGGSLGVVLDNEANDTIVLDGVSEQVMRASMGTKSLALTASGYVLVFQATLASGEVAIVRATINSSDVPPSTDAFTVYKDFTDDNASSVSIGLSCTNGTVVNSPQFASEALPAVFRVEGASSGATCTAKENAVPSGYTADETDCLRVSLNSSCTIINKRKVQKSGDLIFASGFDT